MKGKEKKVTLINNGDIITKIKIVIKLSKISLGREFQH